MWAGPPRLRTHSYFLFFLKPVVVTDPRSIEYDSLKRFPMDQGSGRTNQPDPIGYKNQTINRPTPIAKIFKPHSHFGQKLKYSFSGFP